MSSASRLLEKPNETTTRSDLACAAVVSDDGGGVVAAVGVAVVAQGATVDLRGLSVGCGDSANESGGSGGDGCQTDEVEVSICVLPEGLEGLGGLGGWTGSYSTAGGGVQVGVLLVVARFWAGAGGGGDGAAWLKLRVVVLTGGTWTLNVLFVVRAKRSLAMQVTL